MWRRKFLASFVALIAFGTVAMTTAAQEHHGHSWGYVGADGPEHWGDLDPRFTACKVGLRQSPIDIKGAKQADLPAIRFDYKPTPLRIINNGHTIQINYTSGSSITVGDRSYELKQFHFHHPSEEKINGKAFAMVVHLVHADSQGEIAVVAVLLDTAGANQLLESIWKHLPQVAGPEETFDQLQINAADLLPSNHSYYTFAGSLTTPPCSEGVTWFVLQAPKSISKEQADRFGKIYPDNARPTQPLNGRDLTQSK